MCINQHLETNMKERIVYLLHLQLGSDRVRVYYKRNKEGNVPVIRRSLAPGQYPSREEDETKGRNVHVQVIDQD